MNRFTENKNGVTPQVNIYLKSSIGSGFGWSAWSLNSKAWSEAYAGLTYAPVAWAEASASYGLEPGGERWATSGWVGSGPVSVSGIYEKGVSGWWYKSVSTYEVMKDFKVGIHSQRKAGTGPYASYKLGPIVLWGSYLFDTNASVFMCAKLVF